jgi:hypothetical protein
MTPTLERFSREAFDRADQAGLDKLCSDLAERLSELFAKAPDWTQAAYSIVQELRRIGHDLWSFDDDSPDSQAWCGSWAEPQTSGELILEFETPSEVGVSWRAEDSRVASARWPQEPGL